MSNQWQRPSGRDLHQLRPITIELGMQKHCAGSAFIKWGDTHVLCAAHIEERVPFHVESGGWISAEYALLPGSTHTRCRRERKSVSGRTAEIQRLIGRSLRGSIDTQPFEGHSLTIDCDVIQADGGTRCAAITGAYVAACIALKQFDYRPPHLAAVSFGIMQQHILTDLCYIEDSQVDVDLNIVLSEKGLIEVQGTAEQAPFTAEQLMEMVQRAQQASDAIFAVQRQALQKAGIL